MGYFPSGTNWEDFLLWIRQRIFTIQNKIPVEDFIDEDLLETENAFSLPNDGDCSISDKAISVPEEEYFKGLFSFALFGYIPTDGGEKYRSSLMLNVVEKPVKIDKKDGRAAVKEDDKKEKKFMKGLEVRGKSVEKKADEEALEGITSIIAKRRKEQEKQRQYLCHLNSVQFEMKYSSNVATL